MKKLMIVLLSLAFVAAFALPSFAGDWNFYGSSRITTFYEDFNDDAELLGNDDGLTHTMQGNSRIGASVSGDVISGGFEYGTGVNVRKLYAVWDMGGGKLTIGQTYTPFNQFWSNQVFGGDSDLLNVGGVYAGREPMVMYSWGGFKVALVEPQGGDVVTNATALPAAGYDTNIDLPQLEAEYHGEAGMFSYSIDGLYATYDVENTVTNDEYSVVVWGLAAGAKVTAGALYFAGNVLLGQNLSEAGLWLNAANGAMYNAVTDDINDEDTVGGILVAGYDLGTANLQAGFGIISNEYDDDINNTFQANEESVWYVQASIDIADGFFVVPEIGQYDMGDPVVNNGPDEGKNTYFGLKWQMNF